MEHGAYPRQKSPCFCDSLRGNGLINEEPKLLNLCRIRIRELVFEANRTLSSYDKILMLESLPLPQPIKNYLRHNTNDYDVILY